MDYKLLGWPKLNRGDPLSQGLISAWAFNEGMGGILHDYSGYNNSGALIGSPSWINRTTGTALQFNGTTHKVVIPSYTQTITSVTVNAWIKVTTNSGAYRRIFSKITLSGAGNWFLLLNVSDQLAFTSSNNSAEYGDGYAYSADDKWHMVTATFDGTTITLYKDGVFQKSRSGSALSGGAGQASIGGYSESDIQFFAGGIDNVIIHNRALSPAEVMQLYLYPARIYRQQARRPVIVSGASPTSNVPLYMHRTQMAA